VHDQGVALPGGPCLVRTWIINPQVAEMRDPDIAEHATEPVEQVIPVVQAHVQQQVLGVAQAAEGGPQMALGHELLELDLLQVVLQFAQRLPGLVERRDDRRRDRASTRPGDPMEPVPGLIKSQDRTGKSYALDPAAFQDKVSWLSGASSRRRTPRRCGRSLISHRSPHR
jgi:hypothetical protein